MKTSSQSSSWVLALHQGQNKVSEPCFKDKFHIRGAIPTMLKSLKGNICFEPCYKDNLHIRGGLPTMLKSLKGNIICNRSHSNSVRHSRTWIRRCKEQQTHS
ncbi:hypothetical protein AMTRI_Chr11g151110 [Amborella trichopoda]